MALQLHLLTSYQQGGLHGLDMTCRGTACPRVVRKNHASIRDTSRTWLSTGAVQQEVLHRVKGFPAKAGRYWEKA
jgi:hypothetical protein